MKKKTEQDIIDCCERMKEAIKERFIGVGEFEYEYEEGDGINIYKCNPYPEGAVWEDMQITYCPFCGKKTGIK